MKPMTSHKPGGHGFNSYRGLRSFLFWLSHTRVMLIKSPVSFHYWAQNSPSLLSYQYILYIKHLSDSQKCIIYKCSSTKLKKIKIVFKIYKFVSQSRCEGLWFWRFKKVQFLRQGISIKLLLIFSSVQNVVVFTMCLWCLTHTHELNLTVKYITFMIIVLLTTQSQWIACDQAHLSVTHASDRAKRSGGKESGEGMPRKRACTVLIANFFCLSEVKYHWLKSRKGKKSVNLLYLMRSD